MAGEPAPHPHLTSEQLFRSHGSFVARFLSQLGVARGDLDDVVQEVFLVVHARGGFTPGRAKPTSYLGSIAVHAAQSYRRRHAKAAMRSSGTSPDDTATASPTAHDQIESHELSGRVRAALASLPQELSAVLLLVEVEGESCGSVASAMDCAVGTIYWRLHTARRRMQSMLEKPRDLPLRAARPARKGAP